MLTEEEFEHKMKDMIVDICEVLYHRGYDVVCVGHIMRLVGVNEQSASKHDDEFFALDSDFEKMLQKKQRQSGNKCSNTENRKAYQVPAGVTLH